MTLSLLHRLIFGATVAERRREFAKALDGQLPTPEQMRRLGRMLGDALCEIRCRHRDPNLVFALADAFHCQPFVMFAPEFQWSWFLIFLEGLERQYPEVGRRYIEAFDEMVGFQAEPGTAPSRAAGGVFRVLLPRGGGGAGDLGLSARGGEVRCRSGFGSTVRAGRPLPRRSNSPRWRAAGTTLYSGSRRWPWTR